MLERIIENWLINTNERSYEAAFRQVLIQRGHTVLFAHEHGPYEFGKDIVSRSEDGSYCAYQLKSGRIDKRNWLKIYDQIQELIRVPISHVGVDSGSPDRAFLVTNGKITHPARQAIHLMNERQGSNRTKIELIERDELLRYFIDAHGEYFPQNPQNLRDFLDLYLSGGAGLLPREKLSNFLDTALFGTQHSKRAKSRAQVKNVLAVAPIMVSYLLKEFEQHRNHYALTQGWTVLAMCSTRYAVKNGLTKAMWKGTLDLLLAEIKRHLDNLRAEAVKRENLLEGDLRADGGKILQIRTTMLLGSISMLAFTDRSCDATSVSEMLRFVNRYYSHAFFWGEGALPQIFWIVKFLEMTGYNEPALDLLKRVFDGILEANSGPNTQDDQFILLPSPYYGPDHVVESTLRIYSIEYEQTATMGSSYVIQSLLEMLVRRNERSFLSNHWSRYTRMIVRQFWPLHDYDLFSWRTESGENQMKAPSMQQSWAQLRSDCVEISDIPPTWKEYAELLPHLVMVYPHRAIPAVMRLLDTADDRA